MPSLDSRLARLEGSPTGHIARAVSAQDFSSLTDDELEICIRMAETELRAGGFDDAYFAAVGAKLERLTDEQLEAVVRGLPLETIP